MAKAFLSTVFPQAEISLLFENSDFDFGIYHLVSGEHQLIFTDGMSIYEQKPSENQKDYNKVELYCLLPTYIDPTKVKWPVHWLNRIAQVPQKNKTWFGPGDTIPAGNPPQNIVGGFEANHFILSKPFKLSEELDSSYDKADFKFLAIIPIFEPELDYKFRNSGTALLNRLAKKGYSEEIDTYRSTVCRKRILGF
ncbi:MAG: suppressor of fused domain protein [Flavobacteriales bacterium]|jgi:hypothetical protein|nr:suppressor of fused domain protein [Flavobacteriales bacterium]